MENSVSILSIASVSPLGNSAAQTWESYLSGDHCFSQKEINNSKVWVAKLNSSAFADAEHVRSSDSKYKSLDNSVVYAMTAARKAIAEAGWKKGENFGINIGSSRGATDLFEKHFSDYLKSGVANTLTSPATTLGNISSWVAHDLQSVGPEISHSITCSTALHAILNGMAWLRSGMADKFLVGGSEAPLTDFTIAQMQALKIYSRENGEFPSRALDLEKKANTMILAEAASVCCLENGNNSDALAVIIGAGYATELLSHNISISAEADCFQKSMRMALSNTNTDEVDAIIMHAPGTIKGDLSEFRAIEKIFGKLPMLTTNKWKTGHSFGASGMLSVELAILMLQHNQFIETPFYQNQSQRNIKKVLVNSVGFGGNAVSLLLSLPA